MASFKVKCDPHALAAQRLWHPTQPGMGSFLILLRTIAKEGHPTRVLDEIVKGAYGRNMINQCKRAHHLATTQGQVADASLIQQLCSKYQINWEYRQPSLSWSRSPHEVDGSNSTVDRLPIRRSQSHHGQRGTRMN